MIQVDDGGQQAGQQHLVQVAPLPQPDHHCPRPQAHQAVRGVVQGGPQPQVVLDDRHLEGVVSRHAEGTEATGRQEGGGAEGLKEGLSFLRLHGEAEGDLRAVPPPTQQGGGGRRGV